MLAWLRSPVVNRRWHLLALAVLFGVSIGGGLLAIKLVATERSARSAAGREALHRELDRERAARKLGDATSRRLAAVENPSDRRLVRDVLRLRALLARRPGLRAALTATLAGAPAPAPDRPPQRPPDRRPSRKKAPVGQRPASPSPGSSGTSSPPAGGPPPPSRPKPPAVTLTTPNGGTVTLPLPVETPLPPVCVPGIGGVNC
jgi:hypothetical protein